MANYYGIARTNYFKVKDETKFREWAQGLHCEVLDDGEAPHTFGLICPDETGIPSSRENEQTGEWEDVDFTGELARHLKPGHVAVIMESGHEARRYVTGYATAVNHKGKVVRLSLTDIYALAKPLGKHITPCEY